MTMVHWVHKVHRVLKVHGVLAAVVGVLLATAPTLAAQGRRVAPGGVPAAGDLAVSPAEIQRMLDGYMLIQAQEVLQLSDEQFPRFLSRVRAWQDTRRRSQGERQRMLQELRRMTAARAGTVDEAAVRERLKALDDLESRAGKEIEQQRTAIDQVLNPYQQARFRIFEETMEQRKIELLMRARQGRGRQNQPQANEEPRN
jgi:hypothetical protein